MREDYRSPRRCRAIVGSLTLSTVRWQALTSSSYRAGNQGYLSLVTSTLRSTATEDGSAATMIRGVFKQALSSSRLNGSWIAHGLTVICGVLLSISTLTSFSAEITVDPAPFAVNQTFARDSLSLDLFNGPNHILQLDYWTTRHLVSQTVPGCRHARFGSLAVSQDICLDRNRRLGSPVGWRQVVRRCDVDQHFHKSTEHQL